ncbi:N-myristoyl transferase [Panaeolus papilionaceus]|nr:N-myristoyl transferase [Panaeolus papilionaceus]
MSSASRQKDKSKETVDTTLEEEHPSDSEGDDHEDQPEIENQPSTSTSQKKKKKKKSKSKRKDAIPDEVVEAVMDRVKNDESVTSHMEVNAENIRQVLQQLKIMDVVKGKAGPGGLNKKDIGEHKFWATQPVPQIGEGPPLEDGYIEPPKTVDEIRQEPYPLPKEFEWATLDIDDPVQNKEVYDLLSLNYVEDDNAAFRFNYSSEFLAWALKPPGYHKEWLIGVRVASNKKLVAFISGVPMTLRVREHTIQVSEINYLCIHKKLRAKRLAPVLIKEVTRRVNLKGIFQAIYTAGVVIPTPVTICRYYHRSLNIPKLIDTRFSYVPRNMTLARLMRINKLESKTSLPGLREMENKDVEAVSVLFANYMKRFDMIPIYDIEEMRHQLISGRGTGEIGSGGPGRREGQVTWSYVVEDSNGNITDFVSFYSLPSTVINSAKYPILEAAYLYYYASNVGLKRGLENEEELKKRLIALIGDALIIANEAKFDVFNALTLMDHVPILPDLKFGVGDGFLNFYLYNWRTASLAGMSAEGNVPAGRGLGVVML